MQVLSALAAGIIFGSFMAHMVPETLEAFHAVLAEQYEPDSVMATFPWATAIMGAVFLLLYSVDRLLIAHGADHSPHAGHDHHAAHSHAATGTESAGNGGSGIPPHVAAQHDHISEALANMSRVVEARAQAEREAAAAAAAAAIVKAAAATAAPPPSVGGTDSRDCDACVVDGDCKDCEEGAAAEPAKLAPSSTASSGGGGHCGPSCEGEDHDEEDGLKAHMHSVSLPVTPVASASASSSSSAVAMSATVAVREGHPHQHHAGETGATASGNSGHDGTVIVVAGGGDEAQSTSSHQHGHAHHHHHHGHGHGHSHGGGFACCSRRGRGGGKPRGRRTEAELRAWVFTGAISVHALFDGLSLGAESSATGFLSVLVAVLAHKAFDGLATGAALYPAGYSLKAAAGMLGVAALATPVGIAIGLGVGEALQGSDGGQAAALAEAIIVSMSGGSFLFISIVELLPAALSDGRRIGTKLLAFATGFAALCALRARAE